MSGIPKVIHQIWSDICQPLPPVFEELSKTWKKHYPKWRYELWNEESMNHFVRMHYPQYEEVYHRFPYHVQRWDAIRYLILDHFGGMYVDFDYESIEPLDKLVKDKRCCFAMEPESHCQIFGKSLMFNNALMSSIPDHPFMQKVIKTVFSETRQKSVTSAASVQPNEKLKKNHIVLHSTGPWMLMDLYDQLSEKEKNDIYLIPDKYVTPFDVDQARSVVGGADTEELNKCLDEAYAVHYFFGLWKNDKI